MPKFTKKCMAIRMLSDTANPIIYRPVPRPSRFEIRQWRPCMLASLQVLVIVSPLSGAGLVMLSLKLFDFSSSRECPWINWLILTGIQWTHFSALQTQVRSFVVDFVRFGDFGNDVCLVSDPYFWRREARGVIIQFLGNGTSLRLGMIFL